jgi:crotonobetainyl-CoA:carnitine CoA-transferase CaiB-like acyl-CoA transferase
VGTYRTQDGKFLAFTCLQGYKYWPNACKVLGREDLITDERFNSHEQLAANAKEARVILTEIFRSAPLSEWRTRLDSFEGQWAFAQDSLELTTDPQVEANGYLGETATSDGTEFKLVTTPVQFEGEPAPVRRAPEFNEHCEEILTAIGYDTDEMLQLKVSGIVA